MRPKISKEEKAAIDAQNAKMRVQQLENDYKMNESRGRGITVGTAFGGTTEMTMRRNDGTFTWCILQPVEVVELINQLAANIGCHIHLQPRQDFSSWRSWNYSTEELEHSRGPQRFAGEGHPPHMKAIAPGTYSSPLPPAEEQPGMPTPVLEKQHEPVAVETPKRRRAAKRAAASS